MKKRLLNALYAVPLMVLGLLYLPSSLALGALIIIVALGQFEFYRLLDMASIPSFRYVGTALGMLLMLATYLGRLCPGSAESLNMHPTAGEWDLYVMAFAVLLLMIRQFPQKNNDRPLATISCTLLGVLYVAFPLSFFARLGLGWGDLPWTTQMKGLAAFDMVFFPILVAKMADAGAFFVGSAIGKHKLFPRISPGKTWEGLAGGLATGVLTGVLYAYFNGGQFGTVQVGFGAAAILGLVVSAAGMVGDLAESLLKRAAGAKDSGLFIPGIGGTLDVMDSLIFAAPVMYVFSRFML